MIHILADPDDSVTTEIVTRAFERSFTKGQVRSVEDARDLPSRRAIVVAIAPAPPTVERLAELALRDSKIILQGQLSATAARRVGLDAVAIEPGLAEAARCDAALPHQFTASRARLVYCENKLGLASPLRSRNFLRFDFQAEWNNLGYGRIGCGMDRWAIGQLARGGGEPVANVYVDDRPVGAAVAVRDLPRGSVLWFARPAGCVDGPDWAIVESFISAYRFEQLPCRPFLRGIPHGYSAAVTMRLDCDEAIASARPLFELYRSRGLPLSLAIRTDQPDSAANRKLMQDVIATGGAILSHSVTHEPDWGGSEQAAEREARDSKVWLERNVEGLVVRHAVSPFHQNPPYVPEALARAGYEAFVGGSIATDPEFLMARGGVPPFAPSGVVCHSQSCMLHGDCLLEEGDPLRIYKEAFRLARDSGEFFGYLDHPFSDRYAYGWQSEAARLETHGRFLDFIAREGSEPAPLLFVNEAACLDFLRGRASARIDYDEARSSYKVAAGTLDGVPTAGRGLSVGYRGHIIAAHE